MSRIKIFKMKTITSLPTKAPRMWFEWGNEPSQHVTVWHVGRDGGVVLDGYMRRTDALRLCKGFDCPYN